MLICSSCGQHVEIQQVHCRACGLHYEGRFGLPRLARLSAEHQRLSEMLVLCAGNLKEMARELDVSYPTLRKRLDALIEALKALRGADEGRIDELLSAVEAGTMPAEQAARIIREINGGP